ncbi:USP32 [Cordylochernes scorpioides]|uniref:ubiquitinyl hydrolase 1 n=1 Tax=Cordylochernes scorpioides TaxID=51811 RepID=A0ABY6JYE2_9ARAC|nr:USP32 [Cordylochernes scorpioides]
MSSSWSSPGEASRGHFLVAYHRKMELYFLAWQKTRPALFGLPVLLPYDPGTTTYKDVYVGVWRQVARLVSPPPPHSHLNHALDCDNSLGYEFPFTLKIVTNDGLSCAICPWYRFCQGCPLECSDLPLGPQAGVVAIDWDPTALHLRYQASMEMDCLDAFTKEERLEEKYMCSRCNTSHPASKKLLIWRLPPILIIHLKRFQQVQNKWVKSHKMVRFPFTDFDPTDYLAPIPKKMALGAGDHAEWEDIHQHRMLLGENPKSLKYRLYAVAVGIQCREQRWSVLTPGCSVTAGSWAEATMSAMPVIPTTSGTATMIAVVRKKKCILLLLLPFFNPLSQEARPEQIDSAYMLLYERETIDYDQYMPDVTGKQPDLQDLQDDDFESDFRKFCSLQ